MENDLSIQDKLAVVTAEIDQAQAVIDEARSKFKTDSALQAELDLFQEQLDMRIEMVKSLKRLNNLLDS